MRKIRGQRCKPTPIILTTRDIDMLTLIGLVKHLSLPQIHREFFPSVDRARRRIRQLFDNKLVNITLAGSTEPSLVSLSTAGLNILKTKRPDLAARIRLPKAIRLTSIEHRLACIDTRLFVANWCRNNSLALLRWSNAGGELGNEIGLKDYSLEPDGCFEMEMKNGLIRIACEIDCGTEGKRVLRNKLKKYTSAFDDGCLRELWIVLTTTGKQRLHTFYELVQDSHIERTTRIFELHTINQRPVPTLVKTVAEVFKGNPTLENVSKRNGI